LINKSATEIFSIFSQHISVTFLELGNYSKPCTICKKDHVYICVQKRECTIIPKIPISVIKPDLQLNGVLRITDS